MRTFRRIVSGYLLSEPHQGMAQLAVIDERARDEGEQEHDADGSTQREAIHPAGYFCVSFSFEGRKRLKRRGRIKAR